MIKFTGDFKKLIPLGFRFCRMYGHNYICYTNYVVGNYNGAPTIWIWKKGREIEIEDFYDLSGKIFKFLEGESFKNNIAHFQYNPETKEIKNYDSKEFIKYLNFFKEEISDEERESNLEFQILTKERKNWRECIINHEKLQKVFQSLEGMYEIIE